MVRVWPPERSAPEASDEDPHPDVLGQRRLFVVSRDGSTGMQLTDDPRYRDESPQWSADGRHILFARVDLEAAEPGSIVSLWLLYLAAGSLEEVVSGLQPWESYGFYWLAQQVAYWRSP